ncbi:MAG TPA: GNAT family N-acetyltransferase [Pyrinomonadaceae bacterium]|jgi:GNAT superfamily N-acetyltransferase
MSFQYPAENGASDSTHVVLQTFKHNRIVEDMTISTRRLLAGEETEVLRFLNRQPLKNVQMLGLIKDHGLEHPANRGTFYGCFEAGRLICVALLGHCVFLDGPLEAIEALARTAGPSHHPDIHVVLGDIEQVKAFDLALRQPTQPSTIKRDESQCLFVVNETSQDAVKLEGLKLAQVEELDEITRLHAWACFEEYGINPLLSDPVGFTRRVLARIEKKRTWILRKDERIIFKADIAAQTDEAAYLEAIWTRPEMRRTGVGSRALRDVCQRLLSQHSVVCLLADAFEDHLITFYQRIGFEVLFRYGLVRYSS